MIQFISTKLLGRHFRKKRLLNSKWQNQYQIFRMSGGKDAPRSEAVRKERFFQRLQDGTPGRHDPN